jgi:hypothetical protein
VATIWSTRVDCRIGDFNTTTSTENPERVSTAGMSGRTGDRDLFRDGLCHVCASCRKTCPLCQPKWGAGAIGGTEQGNCNGPWTSHPPGLIVCRPIDRIRSFRPNRSRPAMSNSTCWSRVNSGVDKGVTSKRERLGCRAATDRCENARERR